LNGGRLLAGPSNAMRQHGQCHEIFSGVNTALLQADERP
jgi:hypothetical protein